MFDEIAQGIKVVTADDRKPELLRRGFRLRNVAGMRFFAEIGELEQGLEVGGITSQRAETIPEFRISIRQESLDIHIAHHSRGYVREKEGRDLF